MPADLTPAERRERQLADLQNQPPSFAKEQMFARIGGVTNDAELGRMLDEYFQEGSPTAPPGTPQNQRTFDPSIPRTPEHAAWVAEQTAQVMAQRGEGKGAARQDVAPLLDAVFGKDPISPARVISIVDRQKIAPGLTLHIEWATAPDALIDDACQIFQQTHEFGTRMYGLDPNNLNIPLGLLQRLAADRKKTQ